MGQRKILPSVAISPEVEVRFWNKVKRSPDGCWEWSGAKSKWGYGYFAVTHRDLRRAHRIAYELANGELPYRSLVCHACDNRLCVRPSHLWAGNDSDNVRDMHKKGRNGTFVPETRRGVDNNKAKLTEAQVREMRLLREHGSKIVPLSKKFGVSIAVISKVCRRELWKHVDG